MIILGCFTTFCGAYLYSTQCICGAYTIHNVWRRRAFAPHGVFMFMCHLYPVCSCALQVRPHPCSYYRILFFSRVRLNDKQCEHASRKTQLWRWWHGTVLWQRGYCAKEGCSRVDDSVYTLQGQGVSRWQTGCRAAKFHVPTILSLRLLGLSQYMPA